MAFEPEIKATGSELGHFRFPEKLLGCHAQVRAGMGELKISHCLLPIEEAEPVLCRFLNLKFAICNLQSPCPRGLGHGTRNCLVDATRQGKIMEIPGDGSPRASFSGLVSRFWSDGE